MREKNRNSRILKRLGEWREKDGSLPPFIELYDQLLHLQTEVKQRLDIPKPDLTEESVADQLRQGLPLVRFDNLPLDWHLVQKHFQDVTNTFAEYLEDKLGDPQKLRDLAANTLLLQQVIGDWYQELSLSSIATEHCVSEELLNITTQATLQPFLTAHSEVLLSLVNHELWRRRNCPICGGKPNFAFLDKEQGARWLLCSRCDAEWLFQRLECPYCGTQNQGSLAYFTNDNELYRLYTCDECYSYIKAIDLRKTESEVLLPLERVLTVDLDRQAEEAGYRPG